MNIEIWSIGKEHDPFIAAGIGFYEKRLRPYCPVQLVLIPPPRRSGNTTAAQSVLLEEKIILEKLQPAHYLILLDEQGQHFSSKAFANSLQDIMNKGCKTLVFLIGGPWGVSDTIKQTARKTISLSPLTFPHQLVRLIMFEQLYRAFSILNNSPYHHE